MPSTADYDQLDSPYRASPYAGDSSPACGLGELTELQAFVGSNANYYFRKWAARLESPEGDVGINWVAFFFPTVWMGYRRMHRNALICVVAGIVMTFGLHALFIAAFKSEGAPVSAMVIANAMFALVCGFYGNAWYLSHAQRQIARAHAHGYEGQRLMFELERRGGTSAFGALAWLVGPFLVFFVIGFVAGLALALRHVAG